MVLTGLTWRHTKRPCKWSWQDWHDVIPRDHASGLDRAGMTSYQETMQVVLTWLTWRHTKRPCKWSWQSWHDVIPRGHASGLDRADIIPTDNWSGLDRADMTSYQETMQVVLTGLAALQHGTYRDLRLDTGESAPPYFSLAARYIQRSTAGHRWDCSTALQPCSTVASLLESPANEWERERERERERWVQIYTQENIKTNRETDQQADSLS